MLMTILIFFVGCADASPSESASIEAVEPTSIVDDVDSVLVHPKEITATVFVDENVNGRFDPNEPTIPNSLIVAQYNVYGDFTLTGALTDESGSVDIAADYTDAFEVAVVEPCGYEATTAVKLSANEANADGVLAFGFRPEKAELGMAEIQVQIWQDDYEDGAMKDGERPLTDTPIYFSPDITWADRNDHYTGLLSVQTDENGIAATSFGNGCDIVLIDPQVDSRITKIRPVAIYEGDQIAFPYDDGLLEVRIGFSDNETEPEPASVELTQFAFANGNPNHPEGFGEWQLLLDSGGYFSLNHIVSDVETDHGITTLLPAENERLWQLITNAELTAVSSSTGDIEPDTVMYTFTLINGDDEKVITIWSTESQENQAIQDLLEGITKVIKSHTGKEIVLR